MATTGIVNGHYMRFFDADTGNPYAKATECTISFSMSSRQTSHKDTAGSGSGWREISAGEKSGSGSTSALELNAVNNENVTYSCSFEFSGEVVRS